MKDVGTTKIKNPRRGLGDLRWEVNFILGGVLLLSHGKMILVNKKVKCSQVTEESSKCLNKCKISVFPS